MPSTLADLGNDLRWMLEGGFVVLAGLFVLAIVIRIVEMARARRRRRLERRYEPILTAITDTGSPREWVDRLARAPRRHHDVIARLLLNRLRITQGDVVDVLRAAADRLGLLDRWRRALGNRRWWERAEAAAALGLVREPGTGVVLLPLLDDRHEQVRAAAATALGWLAEPDTIVPLLSRLSDETRHQRVRIVEALQHFGAEVGPPLIAYVEIHPDLVSLAADLTGQLRLTAAAGQLMTWTDHADPAVRASALHALGTMGLDDRGFYFAVRALGDDHADVRAMAARALGRARRADAAEYLEPRLDDEWAVAAQSAMALRRLGDAGHRALERAMARGGLGADLARQVLWEGAMSGAAAPP